MLLCRAVSMLVCHSWLRCHWQRWKGWQDDHSADDGDDVYLIMIMIWSWKKEHTHKPKMAKRSVCVLFLRSTPAVDRLQRELFKTINRYPCLLLQWVYPKSNVLAFIGVHQSSSRSSVSHFSINLWNIEQPWMTIIKSLPHVDPW